MPPTTDRLPEPFATETMAELCARQGRLGDAIVIYRRLVASADDDRSRGRFEARLGDLERIWTVQGGGVAAVGDLPIPKTPGVLAQPGDGEAMLAWSLPQATEAPAAEVLLILRTPSGIETEKRLVPLEAPVGRVALPAPGLHSVVAAVGSVRAGRFVPLARTPRA